MSMPFLVFSCSNCDFRATDRVCWGRFNYAGPSGPVPLKRDLGWCDECSDLVPVEILPSVQQIKELKSEIVDKMRRITEARNCIEQSRSWIKKLLRCSVELPPKIQELQWWCKGQTKNIEEDQQRLVVLESRKSDPRCLRCGSTSCFPLPDYPEPSGSIEKPGPPAEIGVIHPRCGGNLLVEHSGIWIGVYLKCHTYDTEGRFISREDIRVTRLPDKQFQRILKALANPRNQ